MLVLVWCVELITNLKGLHRLNFERLDSGWDYILNSNYAGYERVSLSNDGIIKHSVQPADRYWQIVCA